MRVIDVPLKLITQHKVSNSHVELNNLEQLALHLLVLPKLIDLLTHAGYDLTLEHDRQTMLLY